MSDIKRTVSFRPSPEFVVPAAKKPCPNCKPDDAGKLPLFEPCASCGVEKWRCTGCGFLTDTDPKAFKAVELSRRLSEAADGHREHCKDTGKPTDFLGVARQVIGIPELDDWQVLEVQRALGEFMADLLERKNG